MMPTPGLHARLSESLRLAVIHRLARDLNAELASLEILRRVLHAAAEMLGTPHASILALRNNQLRAVYALGGGAESNTRPVLERMLENGLAGFALHNYRTIIVNDITANPLWMPLPSEPLSPQEGSALCVPMIHSGDVVGVMTLAHPARSYFTADAVSFVALVSEMGAAALSNALLLEEMRQARQRFSTLFDDAIVPIILTDLDGRIVAANLRAYDFLEYGREELLSRNINDIHRAGTSPIGTDRLEHLRRGFEMRFESAARTKEGTEKPVQVYARRLHQGTNGDCIQWIEHDMTPQVALDQLRRDLSAMVYHDIRGPLGNIYSSLAVLKKLLADHPNPKVQHFLDIAALSERQVQRMVASLLDVQRLEEGSRFLNRTGIELNTVARSAAKQIQPAADDKQVRLRVSLADDLPTMYVDADMVERVIINLLDNAIKYTPERGIVTLTSGLTGDEVFVRVKDTGPGIPHEAQSRIFDKFSRVQQRNMPRGVGLGLAFCRLAVDAHGGRIWVKSEEKNGSTFTFTLPIEGPTTKEIPAEGTAAH